MADVKLNAQQRQKLRTAVRTHPKWDARKGIAEMTKDELIQAAHDLGIDVAAVTGAEAGRPARSLADEPDVAAVKAAADLIGPVDAAALRSDDEVDELIKRSLTLPLADLREELGRLYREEVKPPQVIERVVEKPVVTASPQLPGVATDASVLAAAAVVPIARAPLPDLKVIDTRDAAEVFGLKALKGIDVDIWNDPEAPEIDPDYVFDAGHLKLALSALNATPCKNVWLGGMPGTGKTEFVKQLAARLRRAFVRINYEANSESYTIIGGERVKMASTIWTDGVLTKGLRRPGAIILHDEISAAKPEHLIVLNPVLEPSGKLALPEIGETVEKAPGVCQFAADNSFGGGDNTGMFHGLRPLNRSTLDRFAYVLKFTYLPEEAEAGVLVAKTGLPQEVALHLVRFVNKCRASGAGGELGECPPPSLRQLAALGDALRDGIDVATAFNACIFQRLPDDAAEQVRQLYNAHIDVPALKRGLKGKPMYDNNGTAAAPDVPDDKPAF